MKIEDLISTHYYDLSDNDHYIWTYISSHRKQCENLSIDELAKLCHVSRTTILRFTQHLGLSGYSEFKVLLRLENIEPPLKDKNTTHLIENYQKFLDNLKDTNFESLCQKMYESRRIFAYGTGIIQNHVVLELKRNLVQIGKMVQVISSQSEETLYSKIIDDNDLIFIVSYSGETKRMLSFAKELRLKNVPIISLTTNHHNTLASMAVHNYKIDFVKLRNPYGPQYEVLTNYFLFMDVLVSRYISFVERMNQYESE